MALLAIVLCYNPTMSTLQTTDPAARLIAILDKALTTSPNQAYLNLWATAFDLNVKSVPEIYEQIGLLQQLVDDVEAAIKKVPHIKHPDQYLEPLT